MLIIIIKIVLLVLAAKVVASVFTNKKIANISKYIKDNESQVSDYRVNIYKHGKVKGKKNHKKSVVLEKIFTGERFEFDSVDEARKFLEISKPTWLKFKQNSSKLNKTWKLV